MRAVRSVGKLLWLAFSSVLGLIVRNAPPMPSRQRSLLADILEPRRLLAGGPTDVAAEVAFAEASAGAVFDLNGEGEGDPPTVTINPVGPVNEQRYDTASQQLHLSGTVTNAGSVYVFVNDAFVGSAAINNGQWHLDWIWTDDNPTGTPSDTVTIKAVVSNLYGTASASTTLTINNLDPVVRIIPAGASEGASAAVTFTIQDDGPDTFTLSIGWGDGTTQTLSQLGAGDHIVSHTYIDDDPTGTPQDSYDITANVVDDDTGTGSRTESVLVSNLPPTADAGLNQTAFEGDLVTVSATATDPGSADTHTFAWQVSASNGQVIPAGSGQSYAFTPNDEGDYTATVTATDDDTDFDLDDMTVTVANVDPTITALTLSPASVFEGDAVTLTGTLFDPGVNDVETITIDWGDGSPPSTVTTTGGASSIPPVSHVYADDGPSPGNGQASDIHTINVTVSDGDGGFGSASIDITVNNAQPSMTFTPPTATYYEGSTAYLTGTLHDPGAGDFHSVEVNWGDGETSTHNLAPGPFTIAHVYYEDSAGYPVSVTVTDDDTGTWSGGTSLPVDNVAPTVSLDSLSAIDEGEQLTITGQVSDPGIYDDVTVTFEIDLNSDGDTLDGGESASVSVPATGTLDRSFSHTTAAVPDDGGTFENGNRVWGNETSQDSLAITATGEDDDGGIGGVCASGATILPTTDASRTARSPSAPVEERKQRARLRGMAICSLNTPPALTFHLQLRSRGKRR